MTQNDPENQPSTQQQTQPKDNQTVHPDDIECKPLEECLSPSRKEGPEDQVFFHRPHRFGQIARIPQELDDGTVSPPEVSCVPVTDGTLNIVADLNIIQTWCFQELRLDDLASTLSLAPGETYKYRVKQTQRSKLERDVLKSSETLQKFENSVIDKEVMNVTRTSARNLNWEVSANGSIRLGVFRAGASATVSGGTERTAKNSLEQLEKTTEKSSRQLKLMQKLEVGRTTETVVESEEVRTVSNPYRDRSLQLNFYELSKHYDVINQLDPNRPYDYALVLDIRDLKFDREFVLNNQDFLKEELIDRELWTDLQQTLQRETVRPGPDTAEWFARKALSYLFNEGNVFKIPVPGPVSGDGPEDRTEEEWNDPEKSFIARWERSGYSESRQRDFGEGFAAINIYYEIYKEEISDGVESVDSERLIKLALSLAEYVGPEWRRLRKNQQRKLLDNSQQTEVVRRLPGFLSLVEGGVRPAVGRSRQTKEEPADDESSESDESDGESSTEESIRPPLQISEGEGRENSVIARVVEHIKCNRSYYVKMYLNYISEVTSGFALRDTLEEIEQRADARGSAVADVFDLLDVNNAYQDGYHYVVPKRRDVDHEEFERVMFEILEETTDGVSPEVRKNIEAFDGDVEPTVLEDVVVPADGYYLEAAQGPDCFTGEVPERADSVAASIDIDATEDMPTDDG